MKRPNHRGLLIENKHFHEMSRLINELADLSETRKEKVKEFVTIFQYELDKQELQDDLTKACIRFIYGQGMVDYMKFQESSPSSSDT